MIRVLPGWRGNNICGYWGKYFRIHVRPVQVVSNAVAEWLGITIAYRQRIPLSKIFNDHLSQRRNT
jgi:hypothetical protein